MDSTPAQVLRRNVVANYTGQIWKAVVGFVFLPVYVNYLGIEAWGLVGVFAMLQTWLALLDMGLKPALGREMARSTAGAHTAESIRDLLRTVETIAFSVAAVVVAVIAIAAGWIATHWLKANALPIQDVAQAIMIIGLVVGLRFVEDLYVSSIVGLQRQVLENALSIAFATLRAVGAILVLRFVSPTIAAYFIWQAVVSVVTVTVYAYTVHRLLPATERRARFSTASLTSVWRFAGGIMLISLLGVFLTQIDKVLLSHLLSLEAFGYYALAGTVASALFMLLGPITTALYPRFTQLVTRDDQEALKQEYHRGSQVAAVIMGSASVVLMLFAFRVVLLWTGKTETAARVAPILEVLVLGTLLNGMMWIPYQLQLAHGWTSLSVKTNAIAVCVLAPAIFWIVPRRGAIGAAWMWVALNAGYILIVISFMHRRILTTEKWRWYGEDLALPLSAAVATGLLLRAVVPQATSRPAEFIIIGLTSCAVLAAAAFAAPSVRSRILQLR